MPCKVSFENKTYSDEKQAANELAFCHYPVEVSAEGRTETFASFDEARRFVGEAFSVGAEDAASGARGTSGGEKA